MSDILCVGDESRDVLLFPARKPDPEAKPRRYGRVQLSRAVLPGGVGRIVSMLEGRGRSVTHLRRPPVFCSHAQVGTFADALRVSRFLGTEAIPAASSADLPADLPESVSLLVLWDQNQGFREQDRWWRPLLEKYPDAPVLLRLHAPFEGKLLAAVAKCTSDVAVVVDGRDVRRAGRVHVPRALSWEHTAETFCRALDSDDLAALSGLPAVVAVFGREGAVLQRRDGQDCRRYLIADREALEGQRDPHAEGVMLGLRGAIVCALAEEMAAGDVADLSAAVRCGLGRAAALACAGFSLGEEGLGYPALDLEGPTTPDFIIAPIPRQDQRKGWSLLSTASGGSMLDLAEEVLLKGADVVLAQVPHMRLGKVDLYSRDAIEQHNVVRNLIRGYLRRPGAKPPLSLAVFGQPGSGKSFGVRQILKSLPGLPFKSLTLNLSGCTTSADLLPTFQAIRDTKLRGATPCVFFDEFDAPLAGEPWGWLKYFLAPMHDGEYADGDGVHPLAEAVFLFAGGTATSLAEFQALSDGAQQDAFRLAKGPDFISRLHGFLDVAGPNPVSESDTDWPLRRASVIRMHLSSGHPELFDSSDVLRITPALARALLRTPQYRHGNRSLANLIKSLDTAGLECLTPSVLPADPLLNLYTDAEAFLRILNDE